VENDYNRYVLRRFIFRKSWQGIIGSPCCTKVVVKFVVAYALLAVIELLSEPKEVDFVYKELRTFSVFKARLH